MALMTCVLYSLRLRLPCERLASEVSNLTAISSGQIGLARRLTALSSRPIISVGNLTTSCQISVLRNLSSNPSDQNTGGTNLTAPPSDQISGVMAEQLIISEEELQRFGTDCLVAVGTW